MASSKSITDQLLQGGNVLPDMMNTTRITFTSSDAENLSLPFPTPGGTATQTNIGTTYQPITLGETLTFQVSATLSTFTVGSTVTGTVANTTASFQGTVVSSANTELSLTVSTADISGLPPLGNWVFVGSDDTMNAQSDGGQSFQPIVGETKIWPIEMTNGSKFCMGSIVTGTYSVGAYSASFTAQVVIQSGPSIVRLNYLTVDCSYAARLTGWTLAGDSATINFTDLKFQLNPPLRNVIFADWTFCDEHNWDLHNPFFLQIDEMNQNTAVTSKGRPYWRFMTSGNYITTFLPIKLQQPKDYTTLTFHIFDPDGLQINTSDQPWSVEIVFYQVIA